MPELPEVEITRRHLEPVVCGCVDRGQVAVRRERMPGACSVRATSPPGCAAGGCTAWAGGASTSSADLGDGLTWVTHLGMSGRMSLAAPGDPEAAHTAVVVHLRGGPEVRFVDPRTFGHTAVLTPGELAAAGPSRLGPDALDALPSAPVPGRPLWPGAPPRSSHCSWTSGCWLGWATSTPTRCCTGPGCAPTGPPAP